MIRSSFVSDWSFAIRSAIIKTAEANFPKDVRNWPLANTFSPKAYIIDNRYMAIILRDQLLSGIPSFKDSLSILNEPDAPKDAPGLPNINEWHKYFRNKFSLKSQDAIFIVPLKDSNKNERDDWALWTDSEKELWHKQLQLVISCQYYYLKGINMLGDFYIPPGYNALSNECARFLEDHPNYDKNVFVMMRFDEGDKTLKRLDIELRRILKSLGFEPVRADDKMYMKDRNIWDNVCVYMICCKYSVAILEDRKKDEFNPNIALEYGFMRALDKRTLLFADSGFRNLRADIIGTLREKFDIADIENTIEEPLRRWANELG